MGEQALTIRRFDTIRSIPDRAGSISSIALIRAIAIVLVVWDHSVGLWTLHHHRSWIPLDASHDWVTHPLGVIQDMGWLGVTLFFLVSGYIISEVGTRETRRAFAIKRLLRVYPPLWASMAVIIGVELIKQALDRPHITYSVDRVVWAATLFNYVNGVKAVNGVAWSLIIEVLFYVLVFALLPVLLRRPMVAIVIELALITSVIATAKAFPGTRFDADWFLFAASVAYLPLLVIGQCLWMWHARNVSAARAAVLGAAVWLVFVFGMRRVHPSFLTDGNLYGPSVALGVAILLIALLTEGRWRLPRWLAAVSVVSYSVYLVHGTVLNVMLDGLDGKVPYTIALVIMLVVLAVVSVLMWRYVELPSQQLARRLTNRRDQPGAPPR